MSGDTLSIKIEGLLAVREPALDAFLYEVCDSVIPDGVLTDCRFHAFRIDRTDRVRVEDLADSLSFRVLDYCVPKRLIREAKEKDASTGDGEFEREKIAKRARKLFADANTTGEGGELLLYTLT